MMLSLAITSRFQPDLYYHDCYAIAKHHGDGDLHYQRRFGVHSRVILFFLLGLVSPTRAFMVVLHAERAFIHAPSVS